MNLTPHVFPIGAPAGFTAMATVTITAKSGDQIDALVRGGSVCELEVFNVGTPQVCTINEGVTTFEIVGGTGKFGSATGSGILRSVFNFCTTTFLLDEIILHLNK